MRRHLANTRVTFREKTDASYLSAGVLRVLGVLVVILMVFYTEEGG